MNIEAGNEKREKFSDFVAEQNELSENSGFFVDIAVLF